MHPGVQETFILIIYNEHLLLNIFVETFNTFYVPKNNIYLKTEVFCYTINVTATLINVLCPCWIKVLTLSAILMI